MRANSRRARELRDRDNAPKDWRCQECGVDMTERQAFSEFGCVRCYGRNIRVKGSDLDTLKAR